MRFIGNKENLLDRIDYELSSRNITGNSFFDFFSGTTNVAKFFKKKDYTVYSCDLLYFSYVLQKAYIENNAEVYFQKLTEKLKISFKGCNSFNSPLKIIIDFLNALPPEKGFIYHHYSPGGTQNLAVPRMYFTDVNAQRIDSIRNMIEQWKKNNWLTDSEYYVLLATLIEAVPFYANISGVYAAFNKKWDPRTQKELTLKPISLLNNKKNNQSFHCNSLKLIKEIYSDILYLDPPYNQRQYAPNYHLLETIALYDNPEIKGITGMRDYGAQKSNFCNMNGALNDLEKIVSLAKYKYLILSYNSEGLMPKHNIIEILEKYGNVSVVDFDYARFKSNSNGLSKTKRIVQENLYIVQKNL